MKTMHSSWHSPEGRCIQSANPLIDILDLSAPFVVDGSSRRLERLSFESLAFQGLTTMTEARMPKMPHALGWGVFEDCSKLETVYLNNVTSLGGSVFNRCASLRDVYFNSKPTWVADSFNGVTRSKIRLHLDRKNPEWIAFMDDATMVTPWASLTEEQKAVYKTNFPLGSDPVGMGTEASGFKDMWIMQWPEQVKGLRIIVR